MKLLRRVRQLTKQLVKKKKIRWRWLEMGNYIELNNKKEVAKALAGYSSYTRALYKGIYFDRAWYNVESISQGIKAINKRLEEKIK